MAVASASRPTWTRLCCSFSATGRDSSLDKCCLSTAVGRSAKARFRHSLENMRDEQIRSVRCIPTTPHMKNIKTPTQDYLDRCAGLIECIRGQADAIQHVADRFAQTIL